MDESELLKSIKNSALDDLVFFSNPSKPLRERWVVLEFLKIIGLPFDENETNSLDQSSKTDVLFRDARFQVKEITNPNMLRGKEIKDKYNSIKKAKNIEGIVLPASSQNLPPAAQMYDLVVKGAKQLSESKTYMASKNDLDLIFYITRQRASLVQRKEICSLDFCKLGWRSVSCVNSKQAVVLFAAQDAPDFIKVNSQSGYNIDSWVNGAP